MSVTQDDLTPRAEVSSPVVDGRPVGTSLNSEAAVPGTIPGMAPPVELSADAATFFNAGADMHLLAVARPEPVSALKLLGASPFPKSKFPLLGFLETLYDHISSSAKADLPK